MGCSPSFWCLVMDSCFLRCCDLPPVVVDSVPRFAKDWLDIAPSGEELELYEICLFV